MNSANNHDLHDYKRAVVRKPFIVPEFAGVGAGLCPALHGA
jgi:hypothetical protein